MQQGKKIRLNPSVAKRAPAFNVVVDCNLVATLEVSCNLRKAVPRFGRRSAHTEDVTGFAGQGTHDFLSHVATVASGDRPIHRQEHRTPHASGGGLVEAASSDDGQIRQGPRELALRWLGTSRRALCSDFGLGKEPFGSARARRRRTRRIPALTTARRMHIEVAQGSLARGSLGRNLLQVVREFGGRSESFIALFAQ